MMTPPPTHDRYPLQRAEYVMIGLFWAFFAVLWSADALLSPGGRSVPLFPSAPVWLAVMAALVWALLTPPLFVAAGAAGTDPGQEHPGRSHHRKHPGRRPGVPGTHDEEAL